MLETPRQLLLLNRFALHQWREVSVLHRLLGFVRQWRQGSWLLQWADVIALVLVVLLFGLAPYVSTTLLGLLMGACGAFWALLTLSDEAGEGMTPVHIVVVAFWGVMAIATALSPVKMAALTGLIKLTLNVMLFFLMARVMRKAPLRTTVITFYLFTTLIVSVYGMRQWFFGAAALATWVDPTSNLSGVTRVYSYLGNPNLLAGYLLPGVLFSAAALFAWPRWGPKLLAGVALVLNGTCLVLTFSRGGWMAMVVGLAVFALLCVQFWSQQFPPFWRRWALPLLLGVGATVVVLAVLMVPPLRERVLTVFLGRRDSSNNFRINVWMAVVKMIRDRPILGIGPGNNAFNLVYPLYQQPRFSALSAYSIFLETLVEAGIVGLTAFLWLLTVTLNQGWRWLQRLRETQDIAAYWLMAALGTMGGLLTQGLVDTIWYRPQVSSLWWLCLALIASYYRPKPSQLTPAP